MVFVVVENQQALASALQDLWESLVQILQIAQSRYCSGNQTNTGVCITGALGEFCRNNTNSCQSGYCSGDQTNTGVCTTGVLGEPCRRDDACQRGYCNEHAGNIGICTTGLSGVTCGGNADCESNECKTDNTCL